VGRPILLSGVPYTVIGIVPASVRLHQEVDVWTPLVTDTTLGRRNDFLTVMGRLRPGVEIGVAQQETSTVARRLEAEYPGSNSGWGAELVPLQEEMVGAIRPALLVFSAAVLLVLLIACANVANLMLARVASRQREVTIRAALGASRRRLVGQVLTESVLLALAGGAVGLVIAEWGVQALRSLEPGTIPRVAEIGVDRQALGFAVALSLLTGIGFGLVPAARLLRRDLRDGITDGSRGSSGGTGIRHTRGLLVLSEVALAFMLLVGAALLLRSFDRLQRVDPGFTAGGIITARVGLPRARYPDDQRQRAFAEQLLERVAATPGVRAAALASDPPLGGSPPYWAFSVAGVEAPAPGVVQDAVVFGTSPSYFPTLGIPLVAGRLYAASDRAGAPDVAVISEGLATRYWPGRSALGARITFGDPADTAATWTTVVGVVRDVRQATLGQDPYPQIYLPLAQAPSRSLVVAARADGDPLELAPALRRTLAALDADLPLAEVSTMDQRVAATLARPKVNALLLGGFALAALVLAAVGIYGVIAYGVAQRTRELGIRMALGADAGSVLRLVVRQGMTPVLAGVAVGLAGALAGTRLLRSLLFGVGATDPPTFATGMVVLTAVAVLAAALPALRAARTDPMVALRND
jgi:putative ABC transport system permease protein